MLKFEESQCLNSIFQLNYTKFEKKVIFLHKDLQV